jgi:hypothetical protein
LTVEPDFDLQTELARLLAARIFVEARLP